MCEREATTVEHTPPRCIFPERKDTATGIDYRKNLITVPSCDEHNTARSRDDEYLLHVLAASMTSSDVGLTQYLSKVKRSFERNPSLINSLPVANIPTMRYLPHKAAWEEGYEVKPENDRIDTVICSCARALYFHETTVKFKGKVKVVAPFMSYRDATIDNELAKALAYAKQFLSESTAKGENPDVFTYKFAEGSNTAVMLLCFYGSTEFLIQLDKR